MHEMSVAHGLLSILQAQAEAHGIARVSRVRLKIGRLRGLDARQLRLAFEALATAQDERIKRTDDRGPLVAHVGRHRVLDLGLLHGTRVDRLLQLVKAQFFANVELNQDQNRSAQRSLSRCFHGGCHRSTPISSLLRPFVKG